MLLLGAGYCGVRTSQSKDNPQTDRKYSFGLLGCLAGFLIMYTLQNTILTLSLKIINDFKSTINDLPENLKPENGTPLIAFLFFLYIVQIFVTVALFMSCSFFALLNLRYTAKDIDTHYRVLKTEDVDSDEIFQLKEEDLKKNNEGLSLSQIENDKNSDNDDEKKTIEIDDETKKK